MGGLNANMTVCSRGRMVRELTARRGKLVHVHELDDSLRRGHTHTQTV